MLLGTLGASLLGNLLTGRGAIAKSQGKGVNRAGKARGINRAGEGVLRPGLVTVPLKRIFNAASSFN